VKSDELGFGDRHEAGNPEALRSCGLEKDRFVKSRRKFPPVVWWFQMIGSGLAPLVAMVRTHSPWTNSGLATYAVVMGAFWCLRIANLYRLLGPKAGEYRSLATTRWGRGGAFVVFLGSVLLIITTFATLYWAMSGRTVSTFTEPLSRVDAIYFATTVFTTTGFGDIAPISELARFAVTLQMLFGFALVVGAIGAALSRTVRRSEGGVSV
jgi:hypothetical protein